MGLPHSKNTQGSEEADPLRSASPGHEQLPVPCVHDSQPINAVVSNEDEDFPMSSLNQPPCEENSEDGGGK
ncbi:hypothetical protein KOW79_015697 [Hemibagrus wyckioides]|uniref:Uncharacterized protein n=1 Tax=Hemibagrus wyckioides TaxID=337641 RepID=A0A9D3NFG7_9TELE|nr:hypothetical protein KOW79_015697 [Hemibagrus wyckioides]